VTRKANAETRCTYSNDSKGTKCYIIVASLAVFAPSALTLRIIKEDTREEQEWWQDGAARQANAMSKEEFNNLFQARLKEVKPTSKLSEADNDNRRLDLNFFEKMSLLDEGGTYHIPKFERGTSGDEDNKMCQLFSSEHIKSNDN
jgi:hypothetical protein